MYLATSSSAVSKVEQIEAFILSYAKKQVNINEAREMFSDFCSEALKKWPPMLVLFILVTSVIKWASG